MTDDEMIAEFIAINGVTRGATVYSVSSPQSWTAPPSVIAPVAPPKASPGEDDAKIVQTYLTIPGTMREISRHLGVPERRVADALSRCGVKGKPGHLRRERGPTPIAIDDNARAAIAHYRHNGPITIREVAGLYRIGYDRFRKMLRSLDPQPATLVGKLDATGLQGALDGGQGEGMPAAGALLQPGNGGHADLGAVGQLF